MHYQLNLAPEETIEDIVNRLGIAARPLMWGADPLRMGAALRAVMVRRIPGAVAWRAGGRVLDVEATDGLEGLLRELVAAAAGEARPDMVTEIDPELRPRLRRALAPNCRDARLAAV